MGSDHYQPERNRHAVLCSPEWQRQLRPHGSLSIGLPAGTRRHKLVQLPVPSYLTTYNTSHIHGRPTMDKSNPPTSHIQPNPPAKPGPGPSSAEPSHRLQHVQPATLLPIRGNPGPIDRTDLPDHRVFLLVLVLPADPLQILEA